SETIASSRNVHEILSEILQASLDEMDADYIALQTFEEFSIPDLFEERFKLESLRGAFSLNLPEMRAALASSGSIIAEGLEINKYITLTQAELVPVSLMATTLRVSNITLGFLTALSFSKKTHFREGHRKFLSILGTKAASSLENFRLIDELKEANRELTEANQAIQENFRQTILGFARAIEQNDPYTRGHSDRVAQYSRMIAENLDLGDQFVEDITFAGQLHDIGKIGISPQKLNKAGKLNAPEIRMFRRHPEMGKRILEPIPFMRHLIPGVYCHHEKYDGTGYPQGLKEEEIPLMGRIIAVADTYDAMTSDRSYRKALSFDVALDELKRNSGTQFDPDMVVAFLGAIGKRKSL
ncbi:HD-GYP domain-containing protein, partial [Myxococcota bacterium]|nr:HD-GYP domain-containing protein [Myxococcota bacterium]